MDFAETLYWCAAIRTDKYGEAKITFDLNDSVTSFRALVDGFNSTGLLGSAEATITSKQPFYIEQKLPLEVRTF